MRPAERALLLLCGALDDGLTPLSPHEYRTLRLRMTRRDASAEQRLTEDYLRSLGYPAPAAERIVSLLERQATLDVFLARAAAQHSAKGSMGWRRRARPGEACGRRRFAAPCGWGRFAPCG